MGETKTRGILLKKTLLANDDGLLEFFTKEYGKVVLSVKKFSNSKKRAREIDFFRLLELSIFEGRNSKSLKTVTTTKVFNCFSTDLRSSERGFMWLERLRQILPEERPSSILFETVESIFKETTPEFIISFDLFFRSVILNSLGLLTRFDQERGDVWFNVQNFEFFLQETPGSVKISNTARQLLEFLRRANFPEFMDKKDNLPEDYFAEVDKVLMAIEEFHC
ncbi:DNA repair protein RecO [Candidatus Gracilibacteria bacterium]|nr:DNA repair protein RecO [Candidatus Gracilibacteria bacterium]